MTSLAGYCEKYAALLQGGKGDSQAPQLELLHEIYQLLKTAAVERELVTLGRHRPCPCRRLASCRRGVGG